MSLLALQRQMRDHLLAGAPAIADEFRGDPRAGLAVYHNAYRAQLAGCLADTYEKTAAWLGEDAFDAAARRHIEARPPRSWTLADYDADFTGALAAQYPADPEVADLAWLDWTLRRAFDGPDHPPLDAARLPDIDWDRAIFTFVPTLRLGVVTSNAAALWSAMAEDRMPPPAALLPAPADIRVWRRDLNPRFKTIAPAEAHAIRLGQEGADFGEICEIALNSDDEARTIAMASEILGAWIADEIIAEVR